MAKVFIGSTSRDLHDYRQAAIDECNRLGLVPIAMEFFEAMGVGATEGCRRKLDEADVYVGIFAHRYGYVEPGHAASVTEIEFDYAGDERGLERVCFLLDLEKGDPSLAAHADPEHRERVAALRARVEASVIRDRFISVDDFRGKLRLALLAWTQRTPVLRGPQPPLSFGLLAATPGNRLKHGARQTPFVGREPEVAALRAFLDEPAGLSWLVVAGPAGAGKSRLVQELCTAISPPWRAGFLLAEPRFTEWSAWRPEGPTLIAVDYAAEHVEETRALLEALTHRGADAFARTPVRIVLVERDAQGDWARQLIGSRSAGYMLEQCRSAHSPVVLGPLSDDALWEGVRGLLGAADGRTRENLLAAVRALDPLGRPLFALLAADAVAAGRSVRAWDRDRLLRDVLGRERDAWASRGVTPAYENLLALATLAGGLTEAVLESPPPGIELPSYDDFDRDVYGAMTGARSESDALPPLKPDLLGEFFVLEHARGRNDRVTARRAAVLSSAAWRSLGGSRRVELAPGIAHVVPSGLPLFLRNLVDDYPDHASLPGLLARPEGDDIDLGYWPELVGHAVPALAAAGRMADAIACVDAMLQLTPDERSRVHATTGIIAATFALLPHALRGAAPIAAADLLARIDGIELKGHDGTAGAFGRGVADAVPDLVAAGLGDTAVALLERVLELSRSEGSYDVELRECWARGTSGIVRGEPPLGAREAAVERLQAFCQEFHEEVQHFVWLALAAGALCRTYVADGSRLSDAERMNGIVRALARIRGEKRLVRTTAAPGEVWPLSQELVEDDLRLIRLELAETDALLIDPVMTAGRAAEAGQLFDEIQRVSPRGDADFAAVWAFAAAQHANAQARAGDLEPVSHALAGIAAIAARLPDDPRFQRVIAMLALATLQRAVDAGSLDFAERMLSALDEAATASPEDAHVLANFADGAVYLAATYQDGGDMAAAIRTVGTARRALHSDAARARWIERSGEVAAAEIAAWLDSLENAAAPGD